MNDERDGSPLVVAQRPWWAPLRDTVWARLSVWDSPGRKGRIETSSGGDDFYFEISFDIHRRWYFKNSRFWVSGLVLDTHGPILLSTDVEEET